jgi:hypothetical protein
MDCDKLLTCIRGPLLSFSKKFVLAFVIARVDVLILGIKFLEKTGPRIVTIVVPVFVVHLPVPLVLVLVEEHLARFHHFFPHIRICLIVLEQCLGTIEDCLQGHLVNVYTSTRYKSSKSWCNDLTLQT